MPTPTYVAISKNVLTSNQSSITLSSIPSTYTDLCLLVSARSSDTSTLYSGLLMQINALTTGNTYTELIGYTTGVISTRDQFGASKMFIGFYSSDLTTSNTFGSGEIYIPNYAGSTNKSFSVTSVSERNATSADSSYQTISAGLLSNTAAISSLTINFSGYNILSGSRFDLYGIKNS